MSPISLSSQLKLIAVIVLSTTQVPAHDIHPLALPKAIRISECNKPSRTNSQFSNLLINSKANVNIELKWIITLRVTSKTSNPIEKID